MNKVYQISLTVGLFLTSLLSLPGQSAEGLPPTEEDYYKIITVPVPEGVSLEVGGLVTLPNGSLAAATRRGDIYIIENPYLLGGKAPRFKRFATGMHTVLGLAYVDGALYCAQRTELTKLLDENGDGVADVYETVVSWPSSGHYHEYSFGPKVGLDGSMYVTLNVSFVNPDWWAGRSMVPWRGWTIKIDPKAGTYEPYATGMRSPCGIGMIDGEFFYADNQGDWIGSGGLVHLEKGDFAGHPAGLVWADQPNSPVSARTNDVYYRVNPRLRGPNQAASMPVNIEDEKTFSFADLAKEVSAAKPAAVWLPHTVLGISTSEIITDDTDGAFGPFSGQVFIGDQGQSKIVRVNLEKVKGVYQGAAFNFREGFQSGVLRMSWGNDQSLFVGQTNRGWGSTGKDPYGLERLVWTGKVPFEMHSILARPDGFLVNFTQPVDKASAQLAENYTITSFIYKYHPVYGSPIVERKKHDIRAISLAEDGLSARLVVDGMRQHFVHEVKPQGVKSYRGGYPLLHQSGYYTLNEIPEGDTLEITDALSEATHPMKAEEKEAPNHHDHASESNNMEEMSAAKEVVSPDNPASRTAKKPARTTPKKSAAAPKRGGKRPVSPPTGWDSSKEKAVTLSTLPGMKYDRKFISVKAGSLVKFTFYNNDDMPHNIVFTRPGKMGIVGQAAMALGLDGPSMEYVPRSNDVIYHSKLMAPGTSETLYLEVPKEPGNYHYVCTFPGHWRTMNGVLRVVP